MRGPIRPKVVICASLLLFISYVLTCRLLPAIHYRAFRLYAHETVLIPSHHSSAPRVNLVIASVAKDDVSWAHRQEHANLTIIRYVSDSVYASYRPPVPSIGRESLIYFTYMHDFYDNLPDITIFIHAHEHPWHADTALRTSMTFILQHLDLTEVQKRGYFNLRADPADGCPDRINTTKTRSDSVISEEPYLAEAFRENFGPDAAVPEIMAGPCCSQFAVTRAVIRGNPREQYRRHMDWLMQKSSTWPDSLTGRTWEHLWPWLFLRRAVDCSPEWQTLCTMYAVCFESTAELQAYKDSWKERTDLVEGSAGVGAMWRTVWNPAAAAEIRARLDGLRDDMDRTMLGALERGINQTYRQETSLS